MAGADLELREQSVLVVMLYLVSSASKVSCYDNEHFCRWRSCLNSKCFYSGTVEAAVSVAYA